MAMGLAMLQGISVTVKDARLVIASKKHMAEAMEGSLSNKVSGTELSLFKENDFVLKFDVDGISKLDETPIPPPAMEILKKVTYLAVTGTSGETGGAGALRIGIADKEANSLRVLLELAPILQMLGANASPSFPAEGH
jgi:hypothetical protein